VSGHALLTDHGLAPINACPSLTMASPTVGNSRWLAPEIIEHPRDGAPVVSKTADVFAFGMVVAEVLAGERPFEGMSDSGAAHRILKGERPELSQSAEDKGFTPQLRELVQKCWDQDPAERPTIDEAVMAWKGLDGKEPTQPTPNHRDHGEFAPDAGDLLSEPQPMSPSTETVGQSLSPGKHLSPAWTSPTYRHAPWRYLDARRARKFWKKWFCGLS